MAGTFIAGVFNTAADTPNGSRAPQSVLVNVSNWCLVELRIGDGEFFNPLTEELLYYQHSLSFRDGVAWLDIVLLFRGKSSRRLPSTKASFFFGSTPLAGGDPRVECSLAAPVFFSSQKLLAELADLNPGTPGAGIHHFFSS